jgi:hypothetical protein
MDRETLSIEEFKECFTWRSILGLIIAALVFSPVYLYLNMVSGFSIIAPFTYIIIILLTELSRIFENPLNKHEVFLLWVGSVEAITISSTLFLACVYRAYYVNSPITMGFSDPFTGKPLPYVIPSWWAPPYGSEAYRIRSFFASEWFIPLLLVVLGTFLPILIEMPLAMLMSRLYIEVEQLPFPMMQVSAQIVTTLTEREGERMYFFTIGALIGMLYSIFLYGLPTISDALGVRVQLIPIPWIDFSSTTELILPGSILGIATDLYTLAIGWIFPFNAVIHMLIGSLALWFFGNALTLKLPTVFPEWAREWRRGMNINLLYQRAYLRVWASPIIGITLAAGLLPTLRHYKEIKKAFAGLRKMSSTAMKSGYFSPGILISMYIVGGTISLAIAQLLVPNFPLWIKIIFTFGWTPILALVNGRATGEIGLGITIPYVWEATVIASGYKGSDIWFGGGAYIGGMTASSWLNYTKIAYLTETKPLGFYKAYVLLLPLFLITGFMYVSIFWTIAPIPSAMYPWTLIQWPVQAIGQSIWITRELNVFRPDLILGAFGVLSALYLISELAHLPIQIIGIAIGATLLPPTAITYLMGALIGKYLLPTILGRETWEKNRLIFTAGIGAGEGIIVGIAAAFMMIIKGKWVLPW